MRKFFREFGIWIVIIAVAYIAYTLIGSTANRQPEILYSDLIASIKNEQVESMELSDTSVTAVIKDGSSTTECKAKIPSVETLYEDAGTDIEDQMARGVLSVEANQQRFSLVSGSPFSALSCAMYSNSANIVCRCSVVLIISKK